MVDIKAKISDGEKGTFAQVSYFVANDDKLKRNERFLNGCPLGASVIGMRIYEPDAYKTPEAGFGTQRKSRTGSMELQICSFVPEWVRYLPCYR